MTQSSPKQPTGPASPAEQAQNNKKQKESRLSSKPRMADTGVDIDLYADMESEFPSENFDTDSHNKSGEANESNDANNAGAPDLYDDVLTNIKDEKPSAGTLEKSASSSSLGSSSAPARRYQVYVGNLTWWTTDADIADAVLSVGVNDFLEVKFYENRANGQSKGKIKLF